MNNIDTITQAASGTAKEVQEKMRRYILENFMFGAQADALDNDRSFLESGIIDSTGILEIINFLESEFRIKIADDEIVPENLDSVTLISNYVSRKMAR